MLLLLFTLFSIVSCLDTNALQYSLDYNKLNYDCAYKAMKMLISMDKAISLDPENPSQRVNYDDYVISTLDLLADDFVMEIVGQSVWIGKEQLKDAIYQFALEDEFRRTTNENRYYEVTSGLDGVVKTVVHGEQQVFRVDLTGSYFKFNHGDVHCVKYGDEWLPSYYRIAPGKEFRVA